MQVPPIKEAVEVFSLKQAKNKTRQWLKLIEEPELVLNWNSIWSVSTQNRYWTENEARRKE